VDYKSGEAEVVVNPEWNFNFTDVAAKLDWDGFFVDMEAHDAAAAASLLETKANAISPLETEVDEL
jgi:hypothetical protein